MRRFLPSITVLSLALTVAACGANDSAPAADAPVSDDPEHEDDVELAGDSPEGLTILEFLNAYPTTFETIFVGSTYQLYTETTVDDVGKIVRVYIEID